jgi:hypothetical protein
MDFDVRILGLTPWSKVSLVVSTSLCLVPIGGGELYDAGLRGQDRDAQDASL